MQVHRVAYDAGGGGERAVDVAVGHLVGVGRVPFDRVVELYRALGRGPSTVTTAGRRSYSTAMSSAASSAWARLAATTIATGSPW